VRRTNRHKLLALVESTLAMNAPLTELLARDPMGMMSEEAIDNTDLVDNEQTEDETDHS
jgi:hypothetical protein